MRGTWADCGFWSSRCNAFNLLIVVAENDRARFNHVWWDGDVSLIWVEHIIPSGWLDSGDCER
jgi:hypothetical protein